MGTETVRSHIRAALADLVAEKKTELHKFHEGLSSKRQSAIEMMSPVVSALTELQKEVSAVIECAVEADGPRVTIYFGTRSERLGLNDHSIKIESWGTDTRFQLEVERMGFYGGRAREYMFDTAEEVVQFVVDAAAERVASCEFHSEK